MKSTKRRSEILKLVNQNGNVTVDQLLLTYNVSEETLRRDLRILADSGYVKRVYGGAVKIDKKSKYIPYEDRLSIQYNEKKAIGKYCIKLLENGDSVFIDGRTTCLVFADHIPADMNLTIVTNSTFLANNLMNRGGNLQIFVVGGQLSNEGLLTGPKLYEELKAYRLDKAFFSCIGLDANGCYFAKPDAQQLASTLQKISSELILMADSSKINRQAFLSGLAIDQLDYIVTDEEAPKNFRQAVQQTNCNLIAVDLHPSGNSFPAPLSSVKTVNK